MNMQDWGEALLCGLAGAVALTTVHQMARKVSDAAPEMDVVGMRALAGGLRAAGTEPPDRERLYGLTLAGDLLSNGLYYSLVGTGGGPGVWIRGAALGLAAGFGALALPRRMGLGDPPHSDRPANQVMTVALYLIGGLAASASAACIEETRRRASTLAA